VRADASIPDPELDELIMPNSEPLNHHLIAERLRLLRVKGIGLMAKELANALGTSPQNVSNWETGRSPIPLEYVATLSRRFHVDPRWLWFGDLGGMPLDILRNMDRLSPRQDLGPLLGIAQQPSETA
jgi:transcriptional regulator with XRE-family HTH domain